MIGSARISAKIRAMPIVVVKGSPIPSVTGLFPSGAAESRLIARCSWGWTLLSDDLAAAETPLPGRCRVVTTDCSSLATVRALCCTV